MTIQLLSKSKSFDGEVHRYSHQSTILKCEMKFHVFVPSSKNDSKCLWYLSGLTCTDETFITKAGAIRSASKHNIMLVCPDTSPRGEFGIEGETESWDHGKSAGFYVDATQEKWKGHYKMYSYITEELYNLINETFKVEKHSIFGHSMGGHGALCLGLRNPNKYQSISAFAPICNPINVPWGKKNLGGYLGDDQSSWQQYDASILAKSYNGPLRNILVDQGSADEFLERELHPSALVESCKSNQQHINLELRYQQGYNHNYYFIQTFIDDHIEFHSKYL